MHARRSWQTLVCSALLAGCGSASSAPFDDHDVATPADTAVVDDDTSALDGGADATSGDDALADTRPGTDTGVIDTALAPDTRPPPPDTAPGCPPGSSHVPTKCPTLCTGGCKGDECIVDCTGINACTGADIVCPADMRCTVTCSGISSCNRAKITCGAFGACAVSCSSPSSCGSLEMRCADGAPCTLACSGVSSCGASQLQCGKGACSATCAGLATSLTVDCADSCACTKC